MNARRITPLLLTLAALQTHAQVLPLADAKERARTRNETILIERANVGQAESATAAARAQRLPSVDVDGSYSYTSTYFQIPISIPIPGAASKEIAFGDGHNALFGLTASMPLFSGFKLDAQQNMRALGEETAREALAGRTLDLMTQVTLAYRGAQLARTVRVTLEDQRGYMQELLRTSRALQAAGQALPYDTLMLATRLGEIELNIREAESEHQNFLITLMQLTGSETRFGVDEEVPTVSPLADLSPDSLVQIGCATRPDLLALDIAHRIGEEKGRAARGGYFPQLSGFASLKYGRPGIDPITNDWMGYYMFGAQLKWNLWAWGADREQAQIAALDVEKADLQAAQLRRQLRAGIDRILKDITVLRERSQLLGTQVAAEEAKNHLLRTRYAQGLATTLEVVDGETSLTRAKLLQDQNRIATSMKLTELAATVGLEF